MTKTQRTIAELMLNTGGYLLPRVNHAGSKGYMIYKGNQVPVRWVSNATARIINRYSKKDRKGRITFNLSSIRQMRKNTTLRTLYDESKKIKISTT